MSKTNQVRINAGQWRTRVLKFPDATCLRPTPDRVRQTVFNWLGQELDGLTCLDLFAGTGVMGFESLSRGAKQAVMIEKSALAIQFLNQNKALLNADAAQIIQIDALHFLAKNQQKFDIIFCDPPYQQQWLDKLLSHLSQHLSQDGFLYIEAEYALTTADGFDIVKHSKAGSVYYHLLKVSQVLGAV